MTGPLPFRPAAAHGRAAGFTLLELMVVMVLIGIIFSFAVLSMRGDDVAELMQEEARRLQTLLVLANDEAIIRGEEIGVRFEDNGYEFLVLALDGWQAPDDDLLKPHTLPADITLQLELGNEQALDTDAEEPGEEPPPQVLILSSGEMTPFTLIFESRLSDYRYQLTA
ncbi:MAG: type II secretion system minor pseudopilin GspH, partial [Gammaproteobacteria bacterium]